MLEPHVWLDKHSLYLDIPSCWLYQAPCWPHFVNPNFGEPNFGLKHVLSILNVGEPNQAQILNMFYL
jgi:hypothetical protein